MKKANVLDMTSVLGEVTAFTAEEPCVISPEVAEALVVEVRTGKNGPYRMLKFRGWNGTGIFLSNFGDRKNREFFEACLEAGVEVRDLQKKK